MNRLGLIAPLVDEATAFRRAQKSYPSQRVMLYQCGIGLRGAETAVARARRDEVDSIIVFGTAGGLNPSLSSGDLIVGEKIANSINPDSNYLEPPLTNWLIETLSPISPYRGSGVTHTGPIATVTEKEELWQMTGADWVDMETGFVMQAAREHGFSCGVVRAIVDSGSQSLPAAALAGMCDDGSTSVVAVIRAMLINEQRIVRQVKELIALRKVYHSALQSLSRAAELICARLCESK